MRHVAALQTRLKPPACAQSQPGGVVLSPLVNRPEIVLSSQKMMLVCIVAAFSLVSSKVPGEIRRNVVCTGHIELQPTLHTTVEENG